MTSPCSHLHLCYVYLNIGVDSIKSHIHIINEGFEKHYIKGGIKVWRPAGGAAQDGGRGRQDRNDIVARTVIVNKISI